MKPRFLVKIDYYIVPSPSTALPRMALLPFRNLGQKCQSLVSLYSKKRAKDRIDTAQPAEGLKIRGEDVCIKVLGIICPSLGLTDLSKSGGGANAPLPTQFHRSLTESHPTNVHLQNILCIRLVQILSKV